jgi:hypothetical protein
MMVVYLTNVGSRDVALHGQTPASREARPVTEQWLQTLKGLAGAERAAFLEQLRAPLIEAALDYIALSPEAATESCPPTEQAAIAQVILIASDQAEEQHRGTDTLYGAELVKARLEHLQQSRQSRWRIGRITQWLIRENPADYDVMHAWYSRHLRQVREAAHVFVSVTGSTPAMNTALLIQSIERFGERTHPLYLPQGERQPVPLDIGRQLLRRARLAEARALVEHYAFAAARQVLKAMGDVPDDIVCLCRSADARASMDLIRAYDAANRGLQRAERIPRSFWQAWRNELLDVRQGNPAALAAEAAHLAWLAWQRGLWAEVLVGVVRLVEVVLRWTVAAGLDLPANAAEQQLGHTLEQAAQANAPLRSRLTERLRQREPGLRDARLDRASVPLLLAVTEEMADAGQRPDGAPLAAPLRERAARLAPAAVALDGLRALRNDTVHQLQGVSREDIAARLDEAALWAHLAAVAQAAGAALDAAACGQPFRQAVAQLGRALERLRG